jgi:hypothetical protein
MANPRSVALSSFKQEAESKIESFLQKNGRLEDLVLWERYGLTISGTPTCRPFLMKKSRFIDVSFPYHPAFV